MSPKYWHRLTDCDPRPAPPPPSSLPSFTVGDSSWVVPPHFPVQPPRVQCTPRDLGFGLLPAGTAQLSCPGSEGVRRGGQPGGSELARSGSSNSHRRRRKGGEVGRSRGAEEREGGASALPRLPTMREGAPLGVGVWGLSYPLQWAPWFPDSQEFEIRLITKYHFRGAFRLYGNGLNSFLSQQVIPGRVN